MKKLLLLLFVSIVGCSKDDGPDPACECQPILFRQAINRNLDQYNEFVRTENPCFFEGEGKNSDVDRSTNPITITGPSPEQITLLQGREGACK